MGGIFGVISKKNSIEDLFLGTHYLQHRAQNYCGLAYYNKEDFRVHTHKGLIRQNFSLEELGKFSGNSGIGTVSSEREPISELSKSGGQVLALDGNIVNNEELKSELLKEGATFSGYHRPEEVNDLVLASKIICRELNFEKGIESLANKIQGDFSILVLKKEGIYAARGWGRKPLIVGEKENSYAVSSESISFINTGYSIVKDVKPGEILLINEEGIHTINQLNLSHIKYGTFEWIYTASPASIIDGKPVTEVREAIGKALAKRYPVEADIVSSIPNSGRWHAQGYMEGSGIKPKESFLRYDYSDRSYTPSNQEARDLEARTKLIPLVNSIRDKKIIIVDDSIVTGTQLKNRVGVLKEMGAKEVHARIASPPLMHACKYGKTTKKDEDCIARRMSIEEIQKILKLDSLGYATVEDLEQAIGYPKEQLCLECW